jgi:hypothetical protein
LVSPLSVDGPQRPHWHRPPAEAEGSLAAQVRFEHTDARVVGGDWLEDPFSDLRREDASDARAVSLAVDWPLMGDDAHRVAVSGHAKRESAAAA